MWRCVGGEAKHEKITKVLLEALPTVRASGIKSNRMFLEDGKGASCIISFSYQAMSWDAKSTQMNKTKNNLV